MEHGRACKVEKSWALVVTAHPVHWYSVFMTSMRSSSFSLLLVFAAVALLLGGLTACESNDMGSDDVEVVNPRLVEMPNGERSFTGAVVNHRPNVLSIAQIEVAFYDDDGSRVETMRFTVEDIPAGDSVEFNQTIDSDRPLQQAQVQGILTP